MKLELNSRLIRNGLLGVVTTITTGIPLLHADDTEVFFGQTGPNVNTAANVLFILDNSGSMADYDGGTVRRIDQMKQAILDIVDNTENVNIGLAAFNGEKEGGSILFPVTNISEEYCPDASCTEILTEGRIASSTDDAEQNADPSYNVDLALDNLFIGEASGYKSVGGFRFPSLNVPRGAKITSAYIEMTSSDDTTNTADFVIVGEYAGDANPFTSAASDISGRAPTIAQVSWTPEDWIKDERHRTADIASIVEEIAARADWCGGNAIALGISGTGSRMPVSFDGDEWEAPVLKVKYDPTTVDYDNTCVSQHTIAKVASPNDDAVENKSDTKVRIGDAVLPLPKNGDEFIVGLRFGNVSVPPGAVVTNAYIELQASDDKSGSLSLDISVEDADSAVPFIAQAGNLSGRTPAAAPVAWTGVPSLSLDERVQTPNLASLVNTIVSRAGWAEDNALVFFLDRATSGGSSRDIHSFDGSSAAAARLHIEYQAPSSTANKPVLQTTRDRLRQVVYDFRGLHWTPLLDAYLEGAEYMLGRPVNAGKKRGEQNSEVRHFRLSHPDSYLGGTVVRSDPINCTDDNLSAAECIDEIIAGSPVYVSPLENACQANQIILLSDGNPTHNNAEVGIKAITTGGCASHSDSDENCGRELAKWLSTNDVSSSITNKQTIVTNTVGFKFTGQFLRDLATEGGGEFQEADSATELTRAFQSIFNTIADIDTSFVAPSVAVNQLNRLTNRDDIYFALFKPGLEPKWAGNVKRFELGVDTSSGDDSVQVVDAEGKAAINKVTGEFKSSARSFWSDPGDPADGGVVAEGGVAAELYTGREVLTYLPGDTNYISRYLNSTTDITKNILGIPAESNAYHSDLLAWSVGIDVKDVDKDSSTTDVRHELGDPMHSEPILLNYSNIGGSPASVLFFGTNEGFLHAVDADTGKEYSALIPAELLPNLNKFYANNAGAPHPYGLDGPIAGWIHKDNKNLIIDAGSDEKALLFVGMRRGGENYYAIDVTDPTSPQVEWVIKGGSGAFADLGQSWSKPNLTKIKMGTSVKDVLIFGGGYDVINDSATTRAPSNVGDTIFIVDALTGNLIWSANDIDFPDMKYAVPSNIRILDLDDDGTTDRLYVGDMGGQLWRFDIDNLASTATDLKVTGGVLAVVSGTDAASNRRFFYEPDIALVNQDGKDFLSVALGSGWRSHPLDNVVEDRFYAIRDYAVFSPPRDSSGDVFYPAFDETDLTDVTAYTDGVEPVVADGWYLNMERNGEKVLSEAVTINNQIIFTSYIPESGVGACTAAAGSGSVYVVDVFNAAPVLNLDETVSTDPAVDDKILTKSDRRRDLKVVGIPPPAKILFPADSVPIALVGGDKLEIDIKQKTRTYWVER